MGMVGSIAVLAALAPLSPAARRLLGGEVVLYAALSAAFGAAGVRSRAEPWRLLPRVMAAYPAFHLGYGLGMARGCLRALRRI